MIFGLGFAYMEVEACLCAVVEVDAEVLGDWWAITGL